MPVDAGTWAWSRGGGGVLLVARLSPVQQRVVSAVADGFRAGWLDPLRWKRYWRASDLSDEAVLGDAMTWLTRRQRAAGG